MYIPLHEDQCAVCLQLRTLRKNRGMHFTSTYDNEVLLMIPNLVSISLNGKVVHGTLRGCSKAYFTRKKIPKGMEFRRICVQRTWPGIDNNHIYTS